MRTHEWQGQDGHKAKPTRKRARNGKVYSLRINERKTLDIYAVNEYRRYIDQGLSREQAMQEIAKNYKWGYKEI